MLVPFAVSLGWILFRNMGPAPHEAYPFAIEPIYAGLGSSLLVWLAGRASKSRELRI
jgi:hypothetical protein